MTNALAWPVVIALLAFKFKAELRLIVHGMKKLKLGPVEAEMFEKKTLEVREFAAAIVDVDHLRPKSTMPHGNAASNASATQSTVNDHTDTTTQKEKGDWTSAKDAEDQLMEILGSQRLSPRLVILKVWTMVEDTMRSLAEHAGIDPYRSVMTTLLDLKRRALLDVDEFDLLYRLFALRNTLINTTLGASEDSAINFVSAASTILRKYGLSDKPGRSALVRSSAIGTPLNS